ncbi:MAG: hypothetical protein JWM88_830 [Verrucomicrobia bacterium]|nr:hypothetical protein [Verrucomicrobiota bacterium]
MQLSKTKYRGAPALELSTRAIELVVATQVGPRVTALRSRAGAGENLFLAFPPDERRYHGYYLRGGHRLWHAPEDIVRSYQPDDDPVGVKVMPNGVLLTQRVEPRTGIEKSLKVEMLREHTVKITHTLTNRGLWPVECAAWALTMLRPGGLGILPLPPKGSHERGDLLPGYALVPWSFTDLSLPVWQMRRDFIGIDVGRADAAQKLGITNYPGWSAYWNEGTTFVKYSPVIPGAKYPDLGSCFEVFTNGKMIELETMGPLQTLAPEQASAHVEYWGVLEGLAQPVSDAVFAKSFRPAIAAWLRKLE